LPAHSPRHIAILGGFGFDNLGDDLILRAALRQLRATMEDVEIILHSNNPWATAAEHKGEAVVFSAEALVRQIILRFLLRLSKSYRKYLLPIPGDSFRRLALSVRNSDVVVSLGGGYLNDYSKFLTHFRLAELALMGLCGKPLIIYGQEIGPLRPLSLRMLARLALRFVVHATVRDEESVRVLSGLGLPAKRITRTADESWTYDPTGELKLNADAGKEADYPVVAVNLMPVQVVANALRSTGKEDVNAKHLNDQILSSIAAGLYALTGTGRRVAFISMSPQDAKIGLRLQALLRGRVPCEVLTDLDSQYAALAQARALIGMRMHTIIMAAKMNVPPIAISLLPKLSKTMDELGLREHTVQGFPFDAEEFQNLFNRVVQGRGGDRAAVMAITGLRVRESERKAALNAQIVKAILDRLD